MAVAWAIALPLTGPYVTARLQVAAYGVRILTEAARRSPGTLLTLGDAVLNMPAVELWHPFPLLSGQGLTGLR